MTEKSNIDIIAPTHSIKKFELIDKDNQILSISPKHLTHFAVLNITSSVIYNDNNSYFCLMTGGEFTVSVSKKYESLYKKKMKQCNFSFLRITDERNIRNDIKIDFYSDVVQEYYEDDTNMTISAIFKEENN